MKKHKIVVLTGAGISAESGIKTFRDHNGLWENHRIEDVASPEGFERNPELVHDFYNKRRAQIFSNEVNPNQGHMALNDLAKISDLVIITQNVDNLHERSGTQNILHMHGELSKIRCQKTQEVFENQKPINTKSLCPCCQEKGNLRPHIVWFGEMPFHMNLIQNHLESCDIFISIGTSAQVYPAAIFYQIAKQGGAKTIELNLEKTKETDHFDESIQGKASIIIPKWVESYRLLIS